MKKLTVKILFILVLIVGCLIFINNSIEVNAYSNSIDQLSEAYTNDDEK